MKTLVLEVTDADIEADADMRKVPAVAINECCVVAKLIKAQGYDKVVVGASGKIFITLGGRVVEAYSHEIASFVRQLDHWSNIEGGLRAQGISSNISNPWPKPEPRTLTVEVPDDNY